MDTAQTVERAIGLLELLSGQSLTAAQIIGKTGIHRSTTYRLLNTLVKLGYIRKNRDSGLYSLSTKILTLASSVRETRDIKETARPFIDELHEKTQETIHLAVLDNNELVYLDKRESTRSLRVVMSSRTGSHAPLYCTGIGKVLLTGMPDNQFRQYLKTVKFHKYTSNTITDIQQLLAEMDEIKKNGYAEDREEHEDGVYCIAFPVYNAADEIMAALSVSLPSVRCTEELRPGIIEAIKIASDKISRAVNPANRIFD